MNILVMSKKLRAKMLPLVCTPSTLTPRCKALLFFIANQTILYSAQSQLLIS